MIPTKTDAEIRATGMMVVGAWVRKLRSWRTGSLLDVFLFLYSLVLIFGSRPGTNGVGTGFYHQSMDVEFPRVPDPPKGRHRAVPIGSGTYDFVSVHTQHELYNTYFPFLSFSLVRFMQPRRSAPKEGDNVMATRDCGRGTASLYSRLTMRLRSLAIILPIHLYLLSLESTFATVYHNYHMYAYKAERWHTCPYKSVQEGK